MKGITLPTTLAEVEQQARMLSPNERARLAEVLLKSLKDDALREMECRVIAVR